MLPGNHDAVRPAEPQPTFEKDIQQDYNTTTFVGNPCDFSLHGVRLLSYHGKSIDDFVAGLRTVTYAQILLKRCGKCCVDVTLHRNGEGKHRFRPNLKTDS